MIFPGHYSLYSYYAYHLTKLRCFNHLTRKKLFKYYFTGSYYIICLICSWTWIWPVSQRSLQQKRHNLAELKMLTDYIIISQLVLVSTAQNFEIFKRTGEGYETVEGEIIVQENTEFELFCDSHIPAKWTTQGSFVKPFSYNLLYP